MLASHGVPTARVELVLLMIPVAAFVLSSFVPLTPVRLASAQPAPAAHSTSTAKAGADTLRICADPNNMPFSNQRREGFENRLAELVAGELHRPVGYTWWAQRRGFVRSTLRAGQCDLIAGIPTTSELALVTRPYYRSTYVFVQRRNATPKVTSFDDAALRRLRVGVQYIGDDYSNTPPAHALTNRGIVRNVTGFSIYGNYATESPPSRILEAVADGAIDVAIVWGPLAGHFAKRSRVPLSIVPVSPQVDVPFLPFVFDISMGVRRTAPELRNKVDEILARKHAAIDSILDSFGVPRLQGRTLVTGSHSAGGTH